MNAIFNLQSFCFQIKIYMAMANFIGGGGGDVSLVGKYLRKFAAQLREGCKFWGGWTPTAR